MAKHRCSSEEFSRFIACLYDGHTAKKQHWGTIALLFSLAIGFSFESQAGRQSCMPFASHFVVEEFGRSSVQLQEMRVTLFRSTVTAHCTFLSASDLDWKNL